ncbi:hypothetical protein GLYMA_09G229350v4 [Glycine max]|nr:hypothetical protein GLYMA_09G229350v4 [Glycine max]
MALASKSKRCSLIWLILFLCLLLSSSTKTIARNLAGYAADEKGPCRRLLGIGRELHPPCSYELRTHNPFGFARV